MKLFFSKYHGAGNDFIILDKRQGDIVLSQRQIAFICHRRFGVGADGLIIITPSDNTSFSMIYYNSDGNEGGMCGNGGRCAAAFAQSAGIVDGDDFSFMAADGIHHAVIKDKRADGADIRLKMSDVNEIKSLNNGFFLDTGSPHFVQFVKGLKDIDVFSEGRIIRNDSIFQPHGTNVNFVETIDNMLYMRTYERGVENETLSCGTGAVAAALIAFREKGFASGMKIYTAGGVLMVHFNAQHGRYTEIWLEGPATRVFEGELILGQND